ncbi:hypothetical protein KC19_VG286400 [Ceratodon purpureus]|uniref:Uncharacterized protein n=1 Tax=Ceratodon purpureus TaxID=3225 RepID=A0A8T0HW77_CERPU|nr:hypothetical protein KC19_VG286400 [Ceratodon purpureus]
MRLLLFLVVAEFVHVLVCNFMRELTRIAAERLRGRFIKFMFEILVMGGF